MKNFTKIMAAALLTISATTATATTENGRLFIIGNALSYGYSLDHAQALLAASDAPGVFTGTIMLKANEEFKFMENNDWGGTEYGIPGDGPVIGDVTIVSGTNDEGYKKLSVAEAGNYMITVDTQKLTMKIEKSAYQESEINCCSMFIVGSATAGGWDVNNGTPLYQVAETPYIYTNTAAALTATDADNNAASFKITTALRGGGTFAAEYWLFRDADDAGKISTDGTDDRQWSVTENGDYTVTVNTVDNTIAITLNKDPEPDPDPDPEPDPEPNPDEPEDGIETLSTDNTAAPTIYYNLRGERVDNPANGIFIAVACGEARKVLIK